VQRFYDLDRAIRGNDEFKPLGNIKMSVQKFFRVNGGSTQLKGVIPDIILPDNYAYINAGEKEYENTLPWTEIEPQKYSQNVVQLTNLDLIKQKSASRIANDENFLLADDRAMMIKKNQDISEYSLNLKQYQAYLDKQEKASDKFKDLMKKDIESLVIKNLPQDLDYINSDESRVGRNEEWIKNLQKDFYLEENIFIMKDMIESEPSFTSIAEKISKK
jgi:carboxyl-terminal processing protease